MEPLDNSENKETIFHYLDFNPDGSPTVLLLHGLGADGSSWGYQIPALCEAGLRPIAPDLPGFGKTIPGAGRWTIQKAAQDTARLIVGLAGGPVIVAGISLGGVVALQMALDFPQMISRLVLINTFACLRPKRFDEAGYLLGRFIVTNLRGKEYQAETVAWRLFPKPEQEALRRELVQRILQSDQRVYRQAMQSLALFDVRRRLGELRMPVLLISGQNDSTVPLENQNELAEGITGAEHVVIPDAGHAVIADQAMKFNRVFLEYLKSQAF
jgi:pimeloyl-ACP methyl ester carboxylesterase